MKLYLVRHGETQYNLQGRIQGQHDSPLTPKGLRQADAIAARLSGGTFSAIYSSDLVRARATATTIAHTHRIPVQTTELLRERNFGALEGLTRDEIEAKYPAESCSWRSDPEKLVPPGAESHEEVLSRCALFVAQLANNHSPGDDIIVVCHGGSLRALVLAACDLPMSFRTVMRCSNAGLSILEIGSKTALWVLNDTAHLESVDAQEMDADNSDRST